MAQKRTEGLNVRVLEDKEVLMHFGDNPAIDIKTGTFGPGWHSAGLEPNDSTWNETRNVDSNKTNLTGGQTATSYTAGDVTGSVDLIPGSPVLDYIEWPDTINQDSVLYRKHTNQIAQAHVARVHKFQSGIMGIKVSREKANLTVADRNQGNDPTARTLNIDYINGDDEVMFEENYYLITEDSVVKVEKKIFQDIDNLESKIKSGDAFIPQGGDKGIVYVKATDEVAKDVDGVDLIEFKNPETGETSEAAEAKTVTLPSGVTGGTFTLTVDGHKTSALAYNATAAAVQSAVRAAGAAGVTVTGNAGGPYTVKGAPTVTANGGSLEGVSSTTITVK
ncbi:TPA: hypothetical protein NBQ01_002136 [Corynebacterium striatum]|nr:hypothetical protein [Corynebacterium striatum]